MPMSAYLRDLRARVGTTRLLLPSVTGVVRDVAGRVLLVQQHDDQRWSTPGGAIEPDETPANAVVREVWEETGLLVAPVRVLGVYAGTDFVVRSKRRRDAVRQYDLLVRCPRRRARAGWHGDRGRPLLDGRGGAKPATRVVAHRRASRALRSVVGRSVVRAAGVGAAERVGSRRPDRRLTYVSFAGEMPMANDPLNETLVHARSLLIDLERHIDRAAAERDLGEVARAWVRAVQLERGLRSVLPAEATANVDVPDEKAPASP